MQEAAPCHTAKVCLKWFTDNNIRLLDWPENSPDLNSIENIWYEMKRKISCKKPGSLEDLKNLIKDIWTQELSPEACQRYAASMPERIRKVITMRVDSTRH